MYTRLAGEEISENSAENKKTFVMCKKQLSHEVDWKISSKEEKQLQIHTSLI